MGTTPKQIMFSFKCDGCIGMTNVLTREKWGGVFMIILVIYTKFKNSQFWTNPLKSKMYLH